MRRDRPQVSPVVKVSDASPCGAAVVETRVPQHVADELWRWRVRPGRRRTAVGQPGFRRGDSAVGELLEADRPRVRIEMRWSRMGHPGHIHVAEARSRRALWREASHRIETFGQRHLCVYDSSVVVGAASRGRSSAVTKGIQRELRLTYPYILATDCAEGPLWEESEANLADWGSRGRALPVPAPRRAWAHAFLQGDAEAWRRRVALFDGRQPEPPADGAETLPPEHECAGAAAFYGPGWVRVGPGFAPPPEQTDGEAKIPGPPSDSDSVEAYIQELPAAMSVGRLDPAARERVEMLAALLPAVATQH